MSFGFGDIMGSISPAYGAVSGQGLGGMARNLSPAFLLFQALSRGQHGGGEEQQAGPSDPMALIKALSAGGGGGGGMGNFLGQLGGMFGG